ncbi:unnamed protein product [Schistosoma turkestanicum]|nr:unnamed protein product [Schistosoma turkestanicum]
MISSLLLVVLVLLSSSSFLISSAFGSQNQQIIQYKKLLLSHHNYIRQTRNQCDYKWSVPAEIKLNDLIWDDGLEVTAQQYAEQCENLPSHTHERTTCRWKSVGQNTAHVYSVPDTINVWRNSHRFYNFQNDECQSGHNCYVYKQVVNINTTHIGCGIHLCYDYVKQRNKYMVVCNYAPAGYYGNQSSHLTG